LHHIFGILAIAEAVVGQTKEILTMGPGELFKLFAVAIEE
jgi:hypothetical protein